MEEDEKTPIIAKAQEFAKNNMLFLGVVGLGILLLGIGLVQYFASKGSNNDIQFIAANSGKGSQSTSNPDKQISVDIEGKVQKPGVYALPDNARIQDALIAAGGMSSEADRTYLSKHFNLAQKLSDGAKIYIPGVGETSSADTSVQQNEAQNTASAGVIGDNSGLININSGTPEQLDTLPGVGPVTAQKIINGRPYTTKEELVAKKALGQKTFDGLKDKITAE